ncbi:MAG TPA: PIG-L family deacetylase [Micromonosporaceae bacterium]|nr:PIG-L family deacetylase [Micromonosporaceae bacterium]
MLSLSLAGVRSVVAIGAHPDDIEIGAGGLLLRLVEAVPDLTVRYVLCGGAPARQAEARAAASAFLPYARVTFDLHDLPDGRLPGHWNRVKQIMQDAAVTPADLVIVPSRSDAHQDHRLLGELAITAFRDQIVIQYEIPKWDGDLGQPNVYIPLTAEQAARKVELLNTHFPSQKVHDWWDDEVFYGLMRLRGMESRSRYAEAFTATKLSVSIAPA